MKGWTVNGGRAFIVPCRPQPASLWIVALLSLCGTPDVGQQIGKVTRHVSEQDTFLWSKLGLEVTLFRGVWEISSCFPKGKKIPHTVISRQISGVIF